MHLDKPLTVDMISASHKPALEVLLTEIKEFNGPITTKPIERPIKGVEGFKGLDYKAAMSQYLKEKYGLSVPFASTITPAAYVRIADWAEKQSDNYS